jgi:hypothetical protein
LLTLPHPPVGYGSDPVEPWETLERLLQQLNQQGASASSIRLTIESIRSSTRADSVCLYTAANRTVTDASGPALDPDVARRLVGGLTEGASQGLIEMPLGPGSAALVRLSRSRGVWIIALRAAGLSSREVKIMSLARRMLLHQQRQQDGQNQLKDVLFSLVQCLTTTLDARDTYTRGHSERVARIAVRLGEQLSLSETIRGELYLGGLFHDIGKIGVPDSVLRKPGRLTDEEMAQIQQHTTIGDKIVGHIRQLAHLRSMVRSHHEHYDGSGYPDGLAGDGIPFAARIMAVADACDAMMSDRPYRPAMSAERLEQIFRDGAGKQWDPDLVTALLRCKADVLAIADRGIGESAFRAVGRSLDDQQRRSAVPMSVCLPPLDGR